MKAEYDYLASPLNALRAGDHKRAIQQLEELRAVKPDLIEATYHLARAWQAAGDNDKAKEHYAEVLENSAHPFFAHTRVRLSEMGLDPDAVRGAAPGNTGIVPPDIARATDSEVPAQQSASPEPILEAVADDAAQAEAAPSEEPAALEEAGESEASADDAAQADAAAGSKGKKGKKGKG